MIEDLSQRNLKRLDFGLISKAGLAILRNLTTWSDDYLIMSNSQINSPNPFTQFSQIR